ncbi:MAG TPA: hypothetical protein VNG33_02100 [Polyangiaceae bacterium]|nr:hypothetical protein [Polyangiaceae bacterium]
MSSATSAVSVSGLVFAAFITAGCGLFAQSAPKTSAAATAPVAAAKQQVEASASAPVRHVGDFFVHRFSGSFAADPITLTEEVAAREDSAWVVDFSLTQTEKVERLRVRFDVVSGQAVSAAHFDGKSETPAQLGDYEALLARTVYAADVNDGEVSSSDQTCLVGADELDCETKTYKVWVGEKAATLSVVHSNTFADRDVSGEITTDDGKLIYRAELVEAKQGKPALGVASR